DLSMDVAFVAGAIAGFCVDVPLHPGETIKTRMQSAEGFRVAGGFRGLWSGITPVLLSSVPSSSGFFVAYLGVLRAFGGTDPADVGRSRVLLEATAAAVGELSALSVRVPAEILKQRMQVGQHKSFIAALQQINRKHGLAGFYMGLFATLMRELPFTMVQMTVFEELKRRHPWALREGSVDSLAVGTSCGFVAGGLAGAVTTPLDFMKTRIMLADCKIRTGLFAMLYTKMSEKGLAACFCGLLPRSLLSAAGGAIWLGTFEVARTLLTA
ncbi:unnamed protein product, partial [Polarella glacialis]